MTLAQELRDWHDFYMLGGTASATLIGLMFVAASIGATFFEEKYAAGMRIFLTPTVVHFGAALITCLLAIVPSQTWLSLGAMLLGGSIIGLAYASWVSIDLGRFRRRQAVELVDQVLYALTPLAGYIAMICAAVGLLDRWRGALEILAGAFGLMLLLGLRNAWDMTVWIVMRVPNR